MTVAKNYLHEPEIGELNRIVTMWLDFAEDQARRRKEVFPEGLDRETGCLPEIQRPRCSGRCGSSKQEAGETPLQSAI